MVRHCDGQRPSQVIPLRVGPGPTEESPTRSDRLKRPPISALPAAMVLVLGLVFSACSSTTIAPSQSITGRNKDALACASVLTAEHIQPATSDSYNPSEFRYAAAARDVHLRALGSKLLAESTAGSSGAIRSNISIFISECIRLGLLPSNTSS